ncbi:tetratricopeptide repeat protein 23-like isoform X3 [Pan troglodytes]|uniref:tetratricopeptide repeat protein 23-like isoform X3 n=1 Tax=Pan troglodytes TaxID=9598 RepID=UPI0007DBC3CA|nr:tetratricopeptide repeat protein 23-like isoform X3 [Pan troglodytes]
MQTPILGRAGGRARLTCGDGKAEGKARAAVGASQQGLSEPEVPRVAMATGAPSRTRSVPFPWQRYCLLGRTRVAEGNWGPRRLCSFREAPLWRPDRGRRCKPAPSVSQLLAMTSTGISASVCLPVQAKKHATSAKNTLLTWKANTTSDKEKEEILEALVKLYYTLGVVWLLQNRGREAYFNLQKAERNMKELKELYKGGVCELQVSENDLTLALGRASLAIHRLNLALAYFEKAIGDVIAAKGDRTSDLISLYEEAAQIEQLRRNHNQAIQYLQQAHSVCVSLFTEVSPKTAEISALLAKAYAMSGEAQHRDAVEIYFIKSINAYRATLGSEDFETLSTTEEFCKWLFQNGEKQEAYRLLKASLKSQVFSYSDYSKNVAETFHNTGRICFAKGEPRKAIQLLRKVTFGWFRYIFPWACKQDVRRDVCTYVCMYICIFPSLPFHSISLSFSK